MPLLISELKNTNRFSRKLKPVWFLNCENVCSTSFSSLPNIHIANVFINQNIAATSNTGFLAYCDKILF